MKLNLTRWREALRRLEAELKVLKEQRRQPREPGEAFDPRPLLLAKAEVTRLYCLRGHLKGKLHATGQLWFVRLSPSGPYAWLQAITDLATQEQLVRSIEGWMESFLVESPVAREPVAPTTG